MRSWLVLVAALPILLHCKKNELQPADLGGPADLRHPRDLTASGADLSGSDSEDLSVDPLLDLSGVQLDLEGCTKRSPGLAIVAVGNDKSLFVARHSAALGWHEKVATTQVQVEELAARASARQLVVAARASDNQLWAGVEVDCIALAPTLTSLPSASTPVRPALRVTTTNDIVFRGAINNDHRFYVQRFTGSGASSAVTQGNLLSLTTPALYGEDDAVGLVFAGDDGKLYDGVTSGIGGSATLIPSATSSRPPTLVTLGDGSLLVVFTGDDTNLYWTRRTSLAADMGTTWSAPKQLCDGQTGCLIASFQPPTLTLDASGTAVALWVGKDGSNDKGVYASTFNTTGGGSFGAAAQVSDEVTHDPIAAAPGADGATIEAAWVREGDGFLRHARFSGTWQAAVTVEGKAFRAKPELVRIP